MSIVTLGRVHVNHSQFLACTEGGQQWLYTSLAGEFFVFFHIVTVMMQAVMIEKVYYGVPHRQGYFEQADAPEKETAYQTEPTGDDDNYKAINE
jgi:hypothetical protein